MSAFEDVPWWHQVLALVPDIHRNEVDSLFAQAISYVWGREDAGDQILDASWGWNFAMAYGKHAAAFASEMISHRHPLAEAYRMFQAGRDLDAPYSFNSAEEAAA